MSSNYSPHRDAGGTLLFPSPTHLRSIDPASALSQLRRSLSRSPSRTPSFRALASRSPCASPSSPLSPSACRSTTMLAGAAAVMHPSPLASPFPASARKTRVARKVSPKRASAVQPTVLGSPSRRALAVCTDNGNATPPSSSAESLTDSENAQADTEMSYENDRATESKSSIFGQAGKQAFLTPFYALSRRDRSSALSNFNAKSSPLKRTDASMDVDVTATANPSAKRRSLHGFSTGSDFNVFDQFLAQQAKEPLHESAQGRDLSTDTRSNGGDSAGLTAFPRRSSSLRKSTLQQRYESPLHSRGPAAQGELDLEPPSHNKKVFRRSLATRQTYNDSSFALQGSLPSASAHPLVHGKQEQRRGGSHGPPQRHPLSRTITQSSASSGPAEDSPTHAPVPHPLGHRYGVDFSKSLPLGAAPPYRQKEESQDTEGSFSTPESYRLAKPLPAAFMSTGLISKKNKDISNEDIDFRASTSTMPDTPCKRPISMINMPTAESPESVVKKPHETRRSLHAFGTPSTPFHPYASRPSLGRPGRGAGIFGSSYNSGSHARRGSFLSNDGDEPTARPSFVKEESQSSNEADLPPTPTKNVLAASLGAKSAGKQDAGAWMEDGANSVSVFEPSSPLSLLSCKSPPGQIPAERQSGAGDGRVEEHSSSAVLRFRDPRDVPTFSSRFRDVHRSPCRSQLARRPGPLPVTRVAKFKAKGAPLSPASPVLGRSIQKSPHTPKDSFVPPDPSGLSISGRAEPSNFRTSVNFSASNATFPPATPTAPRDSLRFSNRHSNVTPGQLVLASDVDTNLTSRFDQVELIGNGEFSSVFRVAIKAASDSANSYFTSPTTNRFAQTAAEKQVFAVKKSRQPYLGPKDRKQKLQEVEVLRALGECEHTLLFVDSWEADHHLYIQTEFCEEGSLKTFLRNVGQKARLDDFRIWKIMLELSSGLKHVHDSGFIHLDLKPANVLITFEGVLKIADFGMASPWPAQAHIEGEGDREYIGPEVLQGRFDKPADIFALGLIMLEIAGNVMLPDHGDSWQRLRSGDMSDVPSLTSTSEVSSITRDDSGMPIEPSNITSSDDFCDDLDFGSNTHNCCQSSPWNVAPRTRRPILPYRYSRAGELAQPPDFMVDPENEAALDRVVRWMISPEPNDRPLVGDLLDTRGVSFASHRRRAGATVYEGNWGPADAVLQDDEEMMDV